MTGDKIALYTTVYPGVEKYLADWYKSVIAQTDSNFDIWIGVDGLDVSYIIEGMGTDPCAIWVIANKGDTPAQIRGKAIKKIVDEYYAVIFVDSDDILETTRVEAAKKYLEIGDVNGCAMHIIDEKGRDLGIVFRPPNGIDITKILPRKNIFGLSNTAYRTKILKQCLPIPKDCVLVDWFLATRAWIAGASLGFDFTGRMAYRQHPSNMAGILPPFTSQQILQATKYVINHYDCVLGTGLYFQHRYEIENACKYVEIFYRAIIDSQEILDKYVGSLNKLRLNRVWWDYVAHQQLEYIWKN